MESFDAAKTSREKDQHFSADNYFFFCFFLRKLSSQVFEKSLVLVLQFMEFILIAAANS